MMLTKGSKTKELEALVYADPVAAHKQFLSALWWQLPWFLDIPVISQITKVRPAQDDSGKGAIRAVPLGLHEEIKDAELGKFIEYTVVRKLWFPVSHHYARVEFHPAGPGCTRVYWRINYEPMIHAPLLLPSNFIALDFMFADYVKHVNKGKKKSGGSLIGTLVKLLLLGYVAFMVSRFLRIPTKPLHPGQAYIDHMEAFRKESADLSKVVSQTAYLVIGGTGFTGSAIVDDLRKRGAKKIKILGRSFPPVMEFPYGSKKEDRYPLPGIEYVRGDVTDMKALHEAMKGIDVVFHTAVAYGVPGFGSMRGAEMTDKINVGGMKNIYQAAKDSKSVKQIIYTSSVDTVFTHKALDFVNETHPYAAYGDYETTVAEGKWAVGDNYARTKILAEKFLLSMDNKDGIRTASLRPNGIYGPGESIAFKRAVDVPYILGFLFFYFEDTVKNDFSCVYNLVYAHILATVKLASDPDSAAGKAYFITDGEPSSIADWKIFKPAIEAAAGPVNLMLRIPGAILAPAGWAQEVLDKFMFDKFGIAVPPFLSYKEALKVVVTHHFDNSRAQKLLGYKPVMSTAQCQKYTAEEVARRYGMAI